MVRTMNPTVTARPVPCCTLPEPQSVRMSRGKKSVPPVIVCGETIANLMTCHELQHVSIEPKLQDCKTICRPMEACDQPPIILTTLHYYYTVNVPDATPPDIRSRGPCENDTIDGRCSSSSSSSHDRWSSRSSFGDTRTDNDTIDTLTTPALCRVTNALSVTEFAQIPSTRQRHDQDETIRSNSAAVVAAGVSLECKSHLEGSSGAHSCSLPPMTISWGPATDDEHSKTSGQSARSLLSESSCSQCEQRKIRPRHKTQQENIVQAAPNIYGRQHANSQSIAQLLSNGDGIPIIVPLKRGYNYTFDSVQIDFSQPSAYSKDGTNCGELVSESNTIIVQSPVVLMEPCFSAGPDDDATDDLSQLKDKRDNSDFCRWPGAEHYGASIVVNTGLYTNAENAKTWGQGGLYTDHVSVFTSGASLTAALKAELLLQKPNVKKPRRESKLLTRSSARRMQLLTTVPKKCKTLDTANEKEIATAIPRAMTGPNIFTASSQDTSDGTKVDNMRTAQAVQSLGPVNAAHAPSLVQTITLQFTRVASKPETLQSRSYNQEPSRRQTHCVNSAAYGCSDHSCTKSDYNMHCRNVDTDVPGQSTATKDTSNAIITHRYLYTLSFVYPE